MPRRCAVEGCAIRPIYGDPSLLNDRAAENDSTVDDDPREKTSHFVDIEIKSERDSESWDERNDENPTLLSPMSRLFQQQMKDDSAVIQPVQLLSDPPCFYTQADFTDKMSPSSDPTLVSSVSSSTISSVCTNTSCELSRPSSPVPSYVRKKGKRNPTRNRPLRFIFCKVHRKPGMVDVVSRRCKWKLGCTKRPLYGFPGDRPQVCASHKTWGMVDRKSRHCAINHCGTVPSYSFPGDKAMFCLKHALPGMINVMSFQCIFPSCKTRASFGKSRGQKAILCANHRLDFMVDVRSRQCVHAGCIHQPSFAYAGSQPMYCNIHKEAGMTDVKNRNPKRQCRGSKENGRQGQRKEYHRNYQQDTTQPKLEMRMSSEMHHSQDDTLGNVLPVVKKFKSTNEYPSNHDVVPYLTDSNSSLDMECKCSIFRHYENLNTGSNVNDQQNEWHESVKLSSSPINFQRGTQWQDQIPSIAIPFITNLLPFEDDVTPESTNADKGSDKGSSPSFQNYERVGSPQLLSPTSLTTSASWETVVQSSGSSTLTSPYTEVQDLDKGAIDCKGARACMNCNF